MSTVPPRLLSPQEYLALERQSAMTQTVAFGTVPVRIALVDIYRGVEFPESAGR